MDRLTNIEAFVRVAECGSFAEASRQLRLARSVMTHRVRQLEEFVGAPLLLRTTRSVRLSDVGRAFYQDCVELLGRADDLVEQMRDMRLSPKGMLRVHALPGFVLGHLTGVLRAFHEAYPDIRLDLVVNDAVVDPVRDGFDCTLQIFPPSSEQLVERRLFPVRRVFCASPDYLRRHGRPRSPAELADHPLGLYSRYPSRDRWDFYGKGKKRQSIALMPSLHTNSVHLLRDYALEHAAIVCIPTLVAADPVLRGELEIVLPDHHLSAFWLSALYAPTQRGSARLRLFLEHLFDSFSAGAPWDAALVAGGLIGAEIIDGQ
ncbi:MAG: LysR family transcriptional regulator [Burkholderiaceae bacterium]